MFRIIATFLDYEIGPEVFHDGAIELKIHPKAFASEEAALKYIKVYEIKRIKQEYAYEGGVSIDEIDAAYSFDGKQAYIDVRADLGEPLGVAYFGRYVYRVVKA